MQQLIGLIAAGERGFSRFMDWLAPVFLLGLRLYVAQVFFKSGLTKVQDFSSTVALFENEYRVPLLSPQLAAISVGNGITTHAMPFVFITASADITGSLASKVKRV